MPQFNAPSMSMSNPVNTIQNPGSASEAISIQTDVPPRRYADIMTSDVPDLTYDYDYDYDCDFATPHSASSSHMIPTPVFDWNVPLGDEMLEGKTQYSPLLETWPPSSSHLSSPEISRDQGSLDGLDELNWEKQSYNPVEMPPLFPNNPQFYPPDPQPSAPQRSQQSASTSQHAYPSTSSINDTPSTSFAQYSPHTAQPSSSASTCTTISPSALNPASTSPRIRVRPQPYPQPPLKLHQPRPSRRIPIISLAELASASEVLKQPRSRRTSQTKHAAGTPYAHSNGPYPQSPVEVLSPLPLECHGFSPVLEGREIPHLPASKMNSYQQPRTSQLVPNPTLSSRFIQRGFPSKVISCSCGCMESYTIQ